LIAAERARQIEAEHFDAHRDDAYSRSEMAWAAVCYAAPESIYRLDDHRVDAATPRFDFRDPWPDDWLRRRDKRRVRNAPADHGFSPLEWRIRELVMAGALIAAEIDRLQRLAASGRPVR